MPPVYKSFADLASAALAKTSKLPALDALAAKHKENVTPDIQAKIHALSHAENPPAWLNNFLEDPTNIIPPPRYAANPFIQEIASILWDITPIHKNPFVLHFTKDNYQSIPKDDYLKQWHATKDSTWYQFLDPSKNKYGAGIFSSSHFPYAKNWAGEYGTVYNTAVQSRRPLVFIPKPEQNTYLWSNLEDARLSLQHSHPDAVSQFIQYTGYNPYSSNPWKVAKERILNNNNISYLSTDAVSQIPAGDSVWYRNVRDLGYTPQTNLTTRYPEQHKLLKIYSKRNAIKEDEVNVDIPYHIKSNSALLNFLYPKKYEEIKKSLIDSFPDYYAYHFSDAPDKLDSAAKKYLQEHIDDVVSIFDKYGVQRKEIVDFLHNNTDNFTHTLSVPTVIESGFPKPASLAHMRKYWEKYSRGKMPRSAHGDFFTSAGYHTFDTSYPNNMYRSLLPLGAGGAAALAATDAQAAPAVPVVSGPSLLERTIDGLTRGLFALPAAAYGLGTGGPLGAVAGYAGGLAGDYAQERALDYLLSLPWSNWPTGPASEGERIRLENMGY